MGTKKGILIKEPNSCSKCPCLRNSEWGCKCFLTEEDLTYHSIDVMYERGNDCPIKDYDESLFEEN